MPLAVTLAALASAVLCGAYALALRRRERLRSEARVAALASAIDPSHDQSRMFAEKSGLLAEGRPLLRAAIGVGVTSTAVGVVIVAGVLIAAARRDSPAPAVHTTPSLALLSMHHERRAAALTVSGLVRNQGATPIATVTAVVSVFDRDGRVAASAEAPLERVTLEPGDDTPFRVTIPGVANVGRYRVSFRDSAGLVRHVDRRPRSAEPDALALR